MMRTFELWQAPFEQTCMGYDAGADYARVWSGEVPDADHYRRTARQPVEEVSDLLEAIWTTFQRVDPETGPWPPEPYAGRSLSVGDVIVLDGWAAFAVEVAGFAVARGFESAALRGNPGPDPERAIADELDRNPEAEIVVNGETVGYGLAGMVAAARKMLPEVAVDDETAGELLDEAIRRQTGRHPQEG